MVNSLDRGNLPTIFVDTLRVNRINNQQINNVSQSQLAQLAEAERHLGQVSDLNQLRSLLGPNAPALAGLSLADCEGSPVNAPVSKARYISRLSVVI